MSDGRRDYKPGELVPGTIYRVVRMIGAGGMGTVYDVEDTTVGRRFVLKTLHPELCNRTDLAKRMTAEARTLARLAHTNIVEVMTAGVTNDALKLPYYVMEKLNGQSLRQILSKRKSLELAHALHIGIDLLDALEAAHDKGVVHRDIKPDNIFLHKALNGVTITKLLDFGVMKMLDAPQGVTAGRFVGTLRYAAPEQLKGDPATAQSDLYAAGLVIYEMLAGRGPFDDARTDKAIADAHLTRNPPLLMHWSVEVPHALERLLHSALAKNPDKRPKDAFTFGSQLRNLKQAMLAREQAASASSADPTRRDLLSNVPSEVSAVPSSPVGVSPLLAGISARPGSPPPAGGAVVTPGVTPSGKSRVVISPSPSPAPDSLEAHAATEHAGTRASTPQAKLVPPDTPTTKDTIMGMAPPPVAGATLENAPPSAMVGTRGPPSAPTAGGSSIDRRAETRTQQLGGPSPLGPAGTEPIPIVVAQQPWGAGASGAPLPHDTIPTSAGLSADPDVAAGQLLVALHSHDRPDVPSDAASSNTLEPAPDRRRSIAVALVAVGSFGIILTIALSIALRHAGPSAASAPPVDPNSQATAPAAPTLTPPLFDEIPSASASNSNPTPTSTSTPTPNPTPTPTPTPTSDTRSGTASGSASASDTTDRPKPARLPRPRPPTKGDVDRSLFPSATSSTTAPLPKHLPGSGL